MLSMIPEELSAPSTKSSTTRVAKVPAVSLDRVSGNGRSVHWSPTAVQHGDAMMNVKLKTVSQVWQVLSHLQVALHVALAESAHIAQPAPVRQKEVETPQAQDHRDYNGRDLRVLELDEGRQRQVGK